MSNNQKIYLSKPGFICAAGNSQNTQTFVKNLSEGNQSGIKEVKCSMVSNAENKTFYVGKIADDLLKPVNDKFEMRVLEILDFALSSISPVIEKAVKTYGKNRVGVCIGSCDNGSELSFQGHKNFFTTGNFPVDYDLKIQGADYPAIFTAKKFGTEGISLAFSTACSSSASAIVKAKELILSGLCDAVIAGGVDVASDTVLLGFDSLEAISHKKTNPFSKNRNGINLGEGAGIFLLSKDDLDETGIVLAGAGESSDASHMTAPLSDGTGAESAMNSALKDANLLKTQIDYINLHGTGTHLNDSMEAKGVNLVFGNSGIPCSSTKPLMGHTLGAAGSLELVVCFFAIKENFFPVHVWDKVQDEQIPQLNLVADSMSKNRILSCMSNSFAFGGCNVSLIIKQEEL